MTRCARWGHDQRAFNGECRHRFYRVAWLGRGVWGLPQWRARAGPAAEPRRSRAGVPLDKQRSDRGGLLLHVRGRWPMRATCCRRALIGLFSARRRRRNLRSPVSRRATAPLASTPSAPRHSLKSTTTGWVNFVSTTVREVRSARTCGRAKCQFAAAVGGRQRVPIPSHRLSGNRHYSPEVICRR